MSQANVNKWGAAWTEPKNMSAPALINWMNGSCRVIFWSVKIPIIMEPTGSHRTCEIFPNCRSNASLSQYKTGSIDMTYLLPMINTRPLRHKCRIRSTQYYGKVDEYYDFNMNSPKYKNNLKLRQALSMAVDREALVKSVMGQGQKPLYAYATSTD